MLDACNRPGARACPCAPRGRHRDLLPQRRRVLLVVRPAAGHPGRPRAGARPDRSGAARRAGRAAARPAGGGRRHRAPRLAAAAGARAAVLPGGAPAGACHQRRDPPGGRARRRRRERCVGYRDERPGGRRRAQRRARGCSPRFMPRSASARWPGRAPQELSRPPVWTRCRTWRWWPSWRPSSPPPCVPRSCATRQAPTRKRPASPGPTGGWPAWARSRSAPSWRRVRCSTGAASTSTGKPARGPASPRWAWPPSR